MHDDDMDAKNNDFLTVEQVTMFNHHANVEDDRIGILPTLYPLLRSIAS